MADPGLPADWLARANRLATVAALLKTTVHDLNNALQVISGNAEMLREDQASGNNDAIERRTETIGSYATHATATLAELSTFARLMDALEPDSPYTDIDRVCERVLAMRRYSLARAKIQAAFEARTPLRRAAERPRTVLQILLNLELNAERALVGRPAPRLLISAATYDDRVTVTVEDNGPGVDPDLLPRLFQPAIAPSAATLGIGLAASRWLAGRSGGTLDYAPSSLGGAAFTLSLPPA